MAAAGLCCSHQARPGPLGRSRRQQTSSRVAAARRGRARLPLCSAQAGPSRPFGGLPDGAGRQQPAPSQALAASSQVGVPVDQQAVEAPPVAQQAAALGALLQQLGRAATYADKTNILLGLPAVRAFFSSTREGRLVAQELEDLPPKDAYCLAALPAIYQGHVLSLIPTGVPVSAALAKLGAALARVEDFYDSLGGLVGYQLQCLELLAAGGSSHGAGSSSLDSSSSSSSSLEDSMCSTDDAWPATALGQGAPGSNGSETEFLVPVGLDLASPTQQREAAAAVAAGIAALPALAEIYPLGGAGDRLGLQCEQTGESLPTAVLQYCGRSLLENLLRDLQAREYLYWKLHGAQHTTPVAIMTSAAKGNHWRVEQLFEQADWFGRGASSFRLFQQPLVPMVCAQDGRWLLQNPLQVMMKPGGHGVIWKLMIDAGVFDWLGAQGRQAAIVRQISNPMAGTDNTLLALAGAGFPRRRSFGFASCERAVGAAEGMNVLAQERCSAPSSSSNDSSSDSSSSSGQWRYRVTNVEYTEFERLGMADASIDEASTQSVFPANTNVLYVGLQAVERAVRGSMAAGSTDAVLPGMILNTAKTVTFADPLAGGAQRSVPAGRLECTMQNLADCLAQSFESPLESCEERAGLDTFLVYNQRRKVTSSAKRKLKPGSTRISQTPNGSFYDLQRNAADVLSNYCGMAVPELGSVAEYLEHGPGFVFLAHPALGPLWQVMGQKIRGGSLAPRSELQLEVAEACLRDVHVQGSLLVHAEAALGHIEQRPAPRGSSAASSRPLLDRLFTAGSGSQAGAMPPAASSEGSSSSSGNSSSSGDSSSSGGGYSQPCDFSAPPSCEGGTMEARLVFSQRCGRLRLHNVRVANRGVDWGHADNVWWRHSLVRHEACRVLLHGMSEFEARDVTLPGDLSFEVPDGHRMLVTAGPDGAPHVELQPLSHPSWQWQYRMGRGGEVQLELLEIESAADP